MLEGAVRGKIFRELSLTLSQSHRPARVAHTARHYIMVPSNTCTNRETEREGDREGEGDREIDRERMMRVEGMKNLR